MEGDTTFLKIAGFEIISIHSLRMEGDPDRPDAATEQVGFQSTPSAWRETFPNGLLQLDERFQSTPSAWRETS